MQFGIYSVPESTVDIVSIICHSSLSYTSKVGPNLTYAYRLPFPMVIGQKGLLLTPCYLTAGFFPLTLSSHNHPVQSLEKY